MKYQIIIPARAQSKRLPGKNTKILNGIPLIEHSINFALDEMSRKNIWVNTDDENIIDLCKSKNINVLVRPKRLATDLTSTSEVMIHQVNYFEKNKITCDAVILLQPTNPIRKKGLLAQAINLFEKSNRNSLASFSVLEKKIGKINNDSFRPINYIPGQRSQDLEETYYENGLIYITKKEYILSNKIITEDVFPLICNEIESTVDIDYLHDFIFAETLLKLKNEKK